jgi:hypothetical protein
MCNLITTSRWELRTSYPQQCLLEFHSQHSKPESSKTSSSDDASEEQAPPTLRSLGLQNAVLIVQSL